MSYPNTNIKITNQFLKPVENMAMTYLLSNFVFGHSGGLNLPVLGQMNQPSAFAVLSGISSLGAELASNWILPELADSPQIYSFENMILSPTLMGLGLFVLVYSVDGHIAYNTLSPMELLLLGAGSEIASTYANNGLVRPWIDAPPY